MELTDVIVQNAQKNERTLLALSTYVWHQLAFEYGLSEEWEESKNVKWTEWLDKLENGYTV